MSDLDPACAACRIREVVDLLAAGEDQASTAFLYGVAVGRVFTGQTLCPAHERRFAVARRVAEGTAASVLAKKDPPIVQ